MSIVNIYRYLSLLACYKLCYKLCKIDFIVYNCLCNFMHINSMINKKRVMVRITSLPKWVYYNKKREGATLSISTSHVYTVGHHTARSINTYMVRIALC
nr:MAG TPA: hypothetical protein [Caudoviricetes sp.]